MMMNQQNFHDIFAKYQQPTEEKIGQITTLYRGLFDAALEELRKEDERKYTANDAIYKVVCEALKDVNSEIDQLLDEAALMPASYREQFPHFSCKRVYDSESRLGIDIRKTAKSGETTEYSKNVFEALAKVFAMRDYIKKQHVEAMKPYRGFYEWYERFHALRRELRVYGATLTDAAPGFDFEYYNLSTMTLEKRYLSCNELCYRFVVNYLDQADKFCAEVGQTKTYQALKHESNRNSCSSPSLFKS